MSNSPNTHAAEHAEHPPVPYLGIFGTLIIFTGITIAASYIPHASIPGGKMGGVLLGLLIAGFKGALVMIFFMHLKYEKRPVVIIALIPFVLATVLLFALFPDVVNGEYHQDAKPVAAAPATTPATTPAALTPPAAAPEK